MNVWLQRGERWLKGLAAVCLLFMMLATVADILGRHVFAVAVAGIVDLVELALIYLVFLGIPLAFVAGEHIAVDVLGTVLPQRLQRHLESLARWLSVGILLLLCYAMWTPFYDTWVFGDRTLDLRISLVWHWLAIWAGVVLSTLVVLVRALRSQGASP